MKKYPLSVFLFFIAISLRAQCPAGQTNVVITIQPDNLGAETSWVLKNSSTQSSLGNDGPYSNGNTTPVITNVCVDNGTNVTFLISDSHGDGMCCLQGNGNYYIMIGSDTIWKNGTFGFSDSVSFLVPPVAFDLSVVSVNIPEYVDQSARIISGKIVNKGTTTINGMRIHYVINGVSTITQILSGLNIPKFKSYNYSFSTPWIPATTGNFTVKVFATNLNVSNADQNTPNDALTVDVYAAEHLAVRTLLIEAFTSCTDTLGFFSETILDSLAADNQNKTAVIKYHVGFPAPGNDPMYLADSAQINVRKAYYGIPNNIPRAVLDGNSYNGLAYGISQPAVDAEYAKRGIFDITLDESKSGNDVTMNVTTTSLVPFATADIKVFAAITETPVHFSSPPSAGSHTDFTHVFRHLLPNTSGSGIGSPLAGQVNTLSYNYTIDNSLLDSSNLKTIIFIQENNTKEVLQVLLGNVATGNNHVTTIDGIPVNNGASENDVLLFPNPARGQFSIACKQWKIQEVEIADVPGARINVPLFSGSSGSQFVFDISNLPSGIYFVKIKTNDSYINKKLIVVK